RARSGPAASPGGDEQANPGRNAPGARADPSGGRRSCARGHQQGDRQGADGRGSPSVDRRSSRRARLLGARARGRQKLSAPPSNTCRLLARDHAAPGPTLLLTKVFKPWLVRVRVLAWCSRPRSSTASPEEALMNDIQAVLFDLDFTLAKPGPDLGPEGYQRLGRRFGLDLDPAKYKEARAKAVEGLRKHPDFRHDEEIWIAFTERIIRGMGGDSDRASEFAVEMTRAWEHAQNFDLFDDVPPVLAELRRRGLKLGIVSNTGRDVDEFLAHHNLHVDAALSSKVHGKVKPHPTIFQAVLDRLAARARDARPGGR